MSRNYARRVPRRQVLGISTEDAAANGRDYCGGAMMDAKLLVDVIKMPLNGSPGDVEPLCYLVVLKALDRKFENLKFAAGQGGDEPRSCG